MTVQPAHSTNLSMLQRGKTYTSGIMLRRLVGTYLRPYLRTFIAAMLFMAAAAAMRGVFAHTMQLIVDCMTRLLGRQYMIRVSAIIVGAYIVRSTSIFFHTIFLNRVGQRIVIDVQQEMCDHLLNGDLAFFHDNASGTLVSRVTNDVNIMRQAVNECLLNAFRGGLEFICLIAVMFYQDWRLSLIVMGVFPISALYVGKRGKSIRKVASNTQNTTGELAGRLNQIFQGIRHVKAYGNEKMEVARVRELTQAIFKLNLKSVQIAAATGPVMELLTAIVIVALANYGYWQVAHGQSTPGNLVAFITSFLLAYDPMKRMGRVNAQFQAGLAAAERVFTMLDVKPAIIDSPTARALDVVAYGVVFDDVTFAYPDGSRALDRLSITVPAGKTVAIVGSSGAGKSTIINLIPRFYDVQTGRITVGGQDLRDLTIASLRRHIALVSQETALFDDTVAANIAYGLTGATRAEIEQAATSASADAFIRALPDGYDTRVGEQGVKLSGGQRQRIAIARAMLRNAPILLLDEATSALDNESERAVQAALKTLQQGRTTIVVAHRLSTIVDTDLIVVLDCGRVVEQGTHASLLALGKAYAGLYGMQTGTAA